MPAKPTLDATSPSCACAKTDAKAPPSEAAARAGLDRARVVEYLNSDEGVPELEASFDQARRLGVQSVPTFVIDGRYAVQGAQPAVALVDAITEVARLRRV